MTIVYITAGARDEKTGTKWDPYAKTWSKECTHINQQFPGAVLEETKQNVLVGYCDDEKKWTGKLPGRAKSTFIAVKDPNNLNV